MAEEYSLISVLMVEDDPGDQKLIKASLRKQKMHFNLSICSSGEEALEYLNSCQIDDLEKPLPDLILLDLNMPGMGGKAFLAKIKEIDVLKTIPVVILTTSDSEKDILETYQLNAAGYINKPVNLTEFSDVVSRLTDYWFVLCKTAARNKAYAGQCN